MKTAPAYFDALLERLRDERALHGNFHVLQAFASFEPDIPSEQLIFALATLWLQKRYPGLEIGDEEGLSFILTRDAERESGTTYGGTRDCDEARQAFVEAAHKIMCRYAWSQLEENLAKLARDPKGVN